MNRANDVRTSREARISRPSFFFDSLVFEAKMIYAAKTAQPMRIIEALAMKLLKAPEI